MSADDRSGAYRAAAREAAAWIARQWDPDLTVRAWWALLAESGWGFPAWPAEWFGRGLSADAAAGVRSAFAASGALPPPAGLGQLLGGPMLLVHGSQEQRARFLPGLARGEESWCQFFSEPGAGSDLAGAQTRAVRHGDGWMVDGQKVWTSGAQWADRGMLLARTDRDVPKHQGLSFFIIDVGQPGVEVRPLHQMNGEHSFNEVFFTGAHVSDDRIVGEPGGGWSVAVTVLMYERFMASLPSAMPGAKAGRLGQPAGEAPGHGGTRQEEHQPGRRDRPRARPDRAQCRHQRLLDRPDHRLRPAHLQRHAARRDVPALVRERPGEPGARQPRRRHPDGRRQERVAQDHRPGHPDPRGRHDHRAG